MTEEYTDLSKKKDAQTFERAFWRFLTPEYFQREEPTYPPRIERITDPTTLSSTAYQHPPIEKPICTATTISEEPPDTTDQIVVISTMAPEKLSVFSPFLITIRPYENEYRADFFDANLSAFGATRNEAVWNLKDIIASTFYTLLEHENGRLGRGLTRQLAVLKSFLRKTE